MSDSEREELDCQSISQRCYEECHEEYEEEYVCRECRKKETPCYRNGTVIPGKECYRCGQKESPPAPAAPPTYNWHNGYAVPV